MSRAGRSLRGGQRSIVLPLAFAWVTSSCAAPDAARDEASTEQGASTPKASAPAGPVSGTIRGRPFTADSAEVESGILTLWQGDRFSPEASATIFLFLEEGEVPADRSFEEECLSSGATDAHLHLAWTEAGASGPERDSMVCGYRMRLVFGTEYDGILPGTIGVSVPGEETAFEGAFDAVVKGFRLVDGEPDLTTDAFENLHYLAERRLGNRFTPERIEIEDHRGYRMMRQGRDDVTPVGYGEVVYRLDGGEARVQQHLFTKEDRRWQLLRQLEPWEIPHAHPLREPAADGEPFIVFRVEAARMLEREHRAEHGERGIHLSGISPFEMDYSSQAGLGRVTVTYTVEGDDEEQVVRYLFRLEDGGWSLDRRLRPDEQVDYARGEVVPRTGGRR